MSHLSLVRWSFQTTCKTTVSNITIVDGKLLIYKYLDYLYYTFVSFLDLETTYYGTIDGKRPCKTQETMSISNVTFQNSSMVALIETELLEVVIVSCIQLQMSGIMIKDLDLSLRDDDKGLYITQAYNVTILDLSVENISYANIYIQSAYMVTLVNVKVNDNYFSWDPILQIQGIIVLEIGGQFLFRKNERKGVVISAVNNITFKSNSIVEFYDHKIREDLFSVESLTYSNLERGTIIKFETSKLIFENNTSDKEQ